MSYTIHVTLDTSVLDRIVANIPGQKQTIGMIVASEARDWAVGFAPYKTGNLISSIKKMYPGGDVIAQILQDGGQADYGIYQEFGTYKMAAHPFMTPMSEAMAGRYSSPALWQPLFK